ncbi:DUF493 domain-containing protein [Pseudopedobacter sp.]|uniref:DUF493 domain-containing protein n=1 Tax=Pseudopedobacter sp. TaxID=1936787 RepID=UPI00334128E6
MEDQNKIVNFQNIEDGLDGKDFYATFKEKLEQVESFPGKYSFKFIVKNEVNKLDEIKAIFPDEAMQTNESKNGKYISLTVAKDVNDANEVIAYYKKAAAIEGIMML